MLCNSGAYLFTCLLKLFDMAARMMQVWADDGDDEWHCVQTLTEDNNWYGAVWYNCSFCRLVYYFIHHILTINELNFSFVCLDLLNHCLKFHPILFLLHCIVVHSTIWTKLLSMKTTLNILPVQIFNQSPFHVHLPLLLLCWNTILGLCQAYKVNNVFL